MPFHPLVAKFYQKKYFNSYKEDNKKEIIEKKEKKKILKQNQIKNMEEEKLKTRKLIDEIYNDLGMLD